MRTKRFSTKAAFTVIEMLAAIGIIAVLVSLLIPALNMVRKKADQLKQKAQFHSIEIALEAFRSDIGDYPSSDRMDTETPAQMPYGGAQRLAEALVGRDGFGFHQDSIFRADGKDAADIPFYQPDFDVWLGTTGWTPAEQEDARKENMAARKGPYLELETANAVKIADLYGSSDTGLVLADVFGLVKNQATRKKTGMPILYYKARTFRTSHDSALASNYPGIDNNDNIYEYDDNRRIVFNLPAPWASPPTAHPMTVNIFYEKTLNPNFTSPPRPYRAESFILLSAGPDGLYGTGDDIYNFETEN